MQTVRLARCYKSKIKAVCDGLLQLRVSKSSPFDPAVLSTLCLELFVNAILLDLLSGKQSVALRHFDQARMSSEGASATNFKGDDLGGSIETGSWFRVRSLKGVLGVVLVGVEHFLPDLWVLGKLVLE